MNKYFVVVDMQKDFCSGALANPAAAAIVPKIQVELDRAREAGMKVIFTKDTHKEDYMSTGEGKHLPVPHCIKGTDGWEIVSELEVKPEDTILEKGHFAFDGWSAFIQPGDEVTICGTVTSICVAANVSMLKAIEGVEVTVLANCCADLSPEGHEAALTVMSAQQANIIR